MIKVKNIAIFGLGKEGVASANYFGKDNQISILDQKPKEKIEKVFLDKVKARDASFYFDGNLPKNQKFDYIIRSPGVRSDNPLVLKLIKSGAIVTSATKIFFDLCPGIIIGVTGTKGKGTTSALVYEMLKTKYGQVYLAGNIGTPMLEILPKLKKSSFVVLELSSFQLFDLKKSPHIAVVLMITSEHLDWHKTSQEYRQAKKSIVAYQNKNDFAVINQDYPVSKSFANKTKACVYFVSTKQNTNGVYIANGKIISEIAGYEEICPTSDVILSGRHNLQNVAAAISIARILDIESQNIVEILKNFKGLTHRLQLVREINKVKYYNDSFSTTPETTISAIEAFQNPKILILGGSSKKSDFSLLGQKIVSDKSVKALILIGQESGRIKEAVTQTGNFTGQIIKGLKNMKEIVQKSQSLAKAGDIVILSPACASFDMFKNYQDRGEQFINEVKRIGKN
ncbi:UDP-N-acetylmuramoylalanine--D-glutamate ligase [Candidatus Curtissbacteria bacterium RIFCSPHIGHO2_01_FULL_41_44]|uniref:UDP-N-acetylmuramoylalanine--D-glutamate ligase n=1 Tax=Candidatus Curtissbacteria bacterium RIFCSPLOWO2_01_FULL_42_50 TaxID=1797730 RepID=A0A1F5H353_9BACT|nr:MAG: UDP-N-acetylmuramoylalanine--D-glutamate ligase [Candidatus Curtissbacteria bacterium RIFCSPHIGHO2_02_FULL_42_58]OGD94553.1 MAG: UDP-N-acetylmuramoylalanine--D-glutamate ligase [Candidatus Curtissbacteria bacterium RIFCSPHIGHO2_01_FULL_41_44]OGD97937.1 MAG: UDP-N-acetylmuramoylalanine--D-glutamate ligase [Candidatus Curtissbacteria bacterium RIFCSPHIGHO2_12_FULL_42_33]OGD98586.1 MAG: UDP-N-acetylmuramoylalanine--D-glutamate ligase [Candidatus Curtissbacteria bacterium RIFCSPLOWO2_01_FULL